MNSRLAALSAAALLASCGYDVPSKVENGTVVLTQRAQGVNFDDFVTFSVDPIVTVVDETGSSSTTFTVDGSNLVVTISSNMRARNFVEVPWGGNATPADLHIKMTASLGTEDIYYSSGYCGWYPVYYCYPGWTYVSSYNFGTLAIDMGNVKDGEPGGKLPLVWTAAARGILSPYYTPGVPSGGNNVDWARIQEAIDQAFADSPYIQRTP